MQKETDEPLEYATGFTEFLGNRIDLSKRPLIPRPETEFWVEKAIEDIKKVRSKNVPKKLRSYQNWHNYKLRILDIFAGSGCIGLAVLRHCPNTVCDFADIDKKAIEQIKINCKINGFRDNFIMRHFMNKICQKNYDRNFLGRFEIIQSNVFSNINPSTSLRARYDYILANPPYVAIARKNEIQKSVWKYEPRRALLGGKDGLFYIRKFLKQAKSHLSKNGRIYMEFDPSQKKAVEKLIKKFDYSGYKFYKDQYGKLRWVMVK